MKTSEWQRIEPTINTKIDYRNVVIKTFIVPGKNKKKTFATFLSEGTQFAGVIAITKDKKVIIARQFRHGPEKIMDEIPGGGIEVGEDPEVGARRELMEETGYTPGKIELLGVSSRDAYTNGEWFYYLATDCVLGSSGQNLDEDELVEVCLVPIDDFILSAKTDKMTDPTAVLMAYDRLQEINK